MKTTPKTRPSNVTSFILEGRWPLAGFDQRELRRLSKTAKRNGVDLADVLSEAVESFVAKCEAEADLEGKVIKFPTIAKGGSATNRRLKFEKRRQLLIGTHNKTLPVVAMCVSNKNRSALGRVIGQRTDRMDSR